MTAEFAALGRKQDEQLGVRGALKFQPDDVNLNEPRVVPWYGRYDAASGGWQLMLSPQHVLSAARPGAAVAKPNAATAQDDLSIDAICSASEQVLAALGGDPQASNPAESLAQLQTTAKAAAGGTADGLVSSYFQTVTSLHQLADQLANSASASHGGVQSKSTGRSPPFRPLPQGPRPHSQTSLEDRYENLMLINYFIYMAQGNTNRNPDSFDLHAEVVATNLLWPPGQNSTTASRGSSPPAATPSGTAPSPRSTPSATGTTPVASTGGTNSGSGGTPPPSDPPPADPFAGRPLDEVITALWGLDAVPASTSVTHLSAPDAAHAWQVVRVTRRPDGSIELVFYGGPPEENGGVAQGSGSAASGASGASTASAGGAGSQSTASGGSNPPSGNNGGAGGGTAPSGESSTSVVSVDGSNRPGGNSSPATGPGVPPPTAPPAVSMAPPPPPPGPFDPRSAAGRLRDEINRRGELPPSVPAPPLVTTRSPEHTVVIGDDGRTAPPLAAASGSGGAALSQQQINAARAALNRASGGSVRAKGPEATTNQPHHAHPPTASPSGTPPKNDLATKLNGTWELVRGVEGAQSTVNIRVAGETVHFSGSTTAVGSTSSSSWTAQGTVRQEGNQLTGTGTANSPGATTTQLKYSLSDDGQTLTIEASNSYGSTTMTWRRR